MKRRNFFASLGALLLKPWRYLRGSEFDRVIQVAPIMDTIGTIPRGTLTAAEIREAVRILEKNQ